jgi:tRNA (guanosine-2'-O-)-methyltransferase
MKSNLRIKADNAKKFRCKNLIAVLENPKTIENIGSVVRNIDALGVEKLYVIDGNKLLPGTWEEMRDRNSLKKISVSAIKWSFVKTFKNTQDCINYLNKKNFISVVTSPHLKGKLNCILENGKYTQKRLAVWFGNESRGVSDMAVQNSNFCINIPMSGIIESLNLGTSTGIVLYEITKQRRNFLKSKVTI